MPRLTPSIAISVVFHAALLALALWMLSRQEPSPEIRIGSVPVTIVSDVIREAAPTPSPSEELFDEVTPDAAEVSESEAAETPTPTPAPPTPTPPRQTPPRQPTPPQRPPQNPTQRPPQTPPRQPPAQPQRPPREALDLDDLTGGSGPTRRPPGRPATESGSGDAPAATGPQVAVLGRQVIPHWNLNCEVANESGLTIRMTLTIDARGRISDGPTLLQQQSNSTYRAAADGARRAALAAQPYDVPDGYEGGPITFVFPLADICRRRGF